MMNRAGTTRTVIRHNQRRAFRWLCRQLIVQEGNDMESIRTPLGRLVLGVILMLAVPALARINVTPVPPATGGVGQLNGPNQGTGQ